MCHEIPNQLARVYLINSGASAHITRCHKNTCKIKRLQHYFGNIFGKIGHSALSGIKLCVSPRYSGKTSDIQPRKCLNMCLSVSYVTELKVNMLAAQYYICSFTEPSVPPHLCLYSSLPCSSEAFPVRRTGLISIQSLGNAEKLPNTCSLTVRSGQV